VTLFINLKHLKIEFQPTRRHTENIIRRTQLQVIEKTKLIQLIKAVYINIAIIIYDEKNSDDTILTSTMNSRVLERSIYFDPE